MSTLPLTVDTLETTSSAATGNEAMPLTLETPPLMSPQCLKAAESSLTLASSNNDMETPERPSNLTLDSTQQQQLQHSNITPSYVVAGGNISPALSSVGSLSPSFLPEMPQWKRDLIQRRKQNVQRTISASSPSPTSSIASATAMSSSPTSTLASGSFLKTSTSSSSVRSLAGSNTNIDQLASDGFLQNCSTKDFTKTKLKPGSSPLKEKLLGGQYTATSISSSTTFNTYTTKEEIATNTQQQQHSIKYKELKENTEIKAINKEEQYKNEELNDETTTTQSIVTNKQQQQQLHMATRLTGSTNACSSSSSLTGVFAKRAYGESDEREEKMLNCNITGACGNLQKLKHQQQQSFDKCESERLVGAANLLINTGNNINLNTNNNNTNNSKTIGGISGNNINNSNQNINSVSSVNNQCGNNVLNVVKISQKLQENQFIKNEQQQQINSKKYIKFKQNTSSGGNISLDIKSPTKLNKPLLTTSNSATCLTAASAASSSSTLPAPSGNLGLKKKMVAVQEMKKSTQTKSANLHTISSNCQSTQRSNNHGTGVGVEGSNTDLDNNEDLSYGPGIVSKLRCRYLSLALRESMEQQRLNKDQLRRSTSLNNLLDNCDEEENCEEEEEEEDEENLAEENEENKGFNCKTVEYNNLLSKKMGILKTSATNNQQKRFSSNNQGSNGVGVTFTETSYKQRSRHLKRGNDSLKRARSVEALLSEKSPWHTKVNTQASAAVTIEDKIHNARERLHQGIDHMPPKRLTSIIDDTERPPPDLVKQTLKMFEASANRRPRTSNLNNGKGEVASKVETFKNIIKEQKPLVTYPKPLSPSKKLNTSPLKPLKSSTPQANDLLQSPLGRKTLAASAQECLTPIKTNNLSEHTPDIIPRQKFSTERDFKRETTDSPLHSSNKRESCNIKEKFEFVDSPITTLTKELNKLRINDSTPIKKSDNSAGHNHGVNVSSNVKGVIRADAGDNVGDACQRHNNKYQYNNDEIQKPQQQQQEEILKTFSNNSLKNENDKIANNNKNKIQNNESTTTTTIETEKEEDEKITTKNEKISTISTAAVTAIATANVNNYDSLTKASSTTTPPPSSSELSDEDEEEKYGGGLNSTTTTTKRITRTALDNIAKAGYSQQFKFNNNTSNTSSPTNNSSSSLNSGKQVGVIRPLLQNQQQQQKSDHSNMETLKHSPPLTSREIEKNRINDLKKSSNVTASAISTAVTTSPHSSASLEHNVIKSTSSPASAASSTAAAGYSDVEAVISATNSPLWAMRKRRQTPPAAPAENTSMVFNFSNRKEVPDYIENDGVIFRRKRELPKPNESGFVLLGDLSVETSTDMDYDDFSMCPPSPCDVEFVNANIVIDGKSSIRQKSKDTAFHVQFNDTLTSTFEYPSEASLIVDDSFSAYNEGYTQPCSSADDFSQAFQNLCLENAATHHHVADEIIQLPTFNNISSSPAAAANTNNAPTKNILGNLPLGSAPLGFYTPISAPIDRLFQLGVTRAPSLFGNIESSSTETTANGGGSRLFNGANDFEDGGGNGSIVGISGGLICDDYDSDLAKKKQTLKHVADEEPDSLQYIRPAEDDLNIAYSEGTQKTDLLY